MIDQVMMEQQAASSKQQADMDYLDYLEQLDTTYALFAGPKHSTRLD